MGGNERISSPRKIVAVGQSVSVTVLSVDAEKRRIALSMNASSRASQVAEEQEAIAKYAPSKQGFGTFADLLKQQTKKK
jgi:ribosomal protein S1